MNMSKIVTRFAPSPTGFLHIGSLRTALFAYLYARQQHGTFILRIEDTDKSREVAGSIEHIMESLRWFSMDWDYGPNKPAPFGSCIQSERLHIYKHYAEQLIAKGLAYPDPYTEEEVEAFRLKATKEKRPFLYRNHRPETFETWDGTKPLRLKAPFIKRYQWHDAVRGDLEAGEEMVDDLIIIKADGYPTYNFAHIIDDLEMGVTHIMRGDEFISSMPKFLSIYDALEIPYPVFVSLPPILRPDRTKKLGKRDGSKDILDYRKDGFLPEALRNFLALIGWNPGTEQELFSMEELIANFSLEKIQRAGGAFNEEKLLWMNREYLNKLGDSEFATYIAPHLVDPTGTLLTTDQALIARLAPTIRERISVASELAAHLGEGEFDFAFGTPTVTPTQLQWKKDTSPKDALPRLTEALRLLETADFSTADTIKAALWDYAEAVGRGELLWPLRVALTGRERSPDPFTVAYIIGKDATRIRLQNAITQLATE
jgi:glutamyl-tRNA synthetase